MEEKKYEIDAVDPDLKSLGFFYIFSRYWLPAIIYLITAIVAIVAGMYIINASGIINIFDYWNVF